MTPDEVRSAADRAAGESPGMSGKPDEVRGHLYNLVELKEITGYDRGTLRAWIDKGLPTVKDGGPGEGYRVSLRTLIEWREAQARAEVRALPSSAFEGWMGIMDAGKAFQAQDRFLNVQARRRSSSPGTGWWTRSSATTPS